MIHFVLSFNDCELFHNFNCDSSLNVDTNSPGDVGKRYSIQKYLNINLQHRNSRPGHLKAEQWHSEEVELAAEFKKISDVCTLIHVRD